MRATMRLGRTGRRVIASLRVEVSRAQEKVSVVVHGSGRDHDAGAAKKRASRKDRVKKKAGDRDVRGDVKRRSDVMQCGR